MIINSTSRDNYFDKSRNFISTSRENHLTSQENCLSQITLLSVSKSVVQSLINKIEKSNSDNKSSGHTNRKTNIEHFQIDINDL